MTNIIALRPDRHLPNWVRLRGLSVTDLSQDHWECIDAYGVGLNRVQRLLAFLNDRIGELTEPSARSALNAVVERVEDSTTCCGVTLRIYDTQEVMELHWPGEFASHCEGCALAESSEDTLRQIASAWSGHDDYDAAWAVEV